MNFVPYLNFNGDCREAFEHYREVFGSGAVTYTTHGEIGIPGISEEWKEKIMNAQMVVGDQMLMGSDVPPDTYTPTASTWVSIMVDTAEEADRIYTELSDGGNIMMPIGEQPWASRFAMFSDRHGVLWMVNTNPPS